MTSIVLIAPYEQILEQGRRVTAELKLKDRTKFFLGSLKQGLAIAEKLDSDDVDVIVTRGGTAQLLKKAGIRTPVVEIPITVQDLAEALQGAQQVTGLAKPRIAMVAFENMMFDITVLTKAMALDLLIYPLNSEEDIPLMVEKIDPEKVDVLITGIKTAEVAARLGLKTVLLTSGEAAIRSAFKQAERVAYARRIEKERAQEFRVLVDYSVQGIISIDQNKKVVVFNPAAEKLLGREAHTVVDQGLELVLPECSVDECLVRGRELVGEIIKANDRTVLANIAPIKVAGSITGAMIAFQDITQIQEMEARIRKEIYTKGLVAKYRFTDVLGESKEILAAKRIAREFATVDATVLILGASGTGKELFAQSIHNSSHRQKGPFVAINCAAIPTSILESELFGYVEGAFTGANRKGKPGLFELAHNGTIFLDEISEMEPYAQSRLLRVIQEKEVMRLGDDKYIPVDSRVIAASNKDLHQLVREGKFREDLFYRLNVLTLNLPALKERHGDVMRLTEYFLQSYCRQFGKKLTMDEAAKQYMDHFDWPGNIRELRNFMEKLVILANSERITVKVIQNLMANREFAIEAEAAAGEASFAGLTEREKVVQALRMADYNQKEASRLLGINRSSLYRRLKRYHIRLAKSATLDAETETDC